MNKKEYSSPELTLVLLKLQDTVMSSNPENHSSYIDSSGDDWGDQNPGGGGIDWG